MGIDETVHLSFYREEWKDIYEQEKNILMPVFHEKAMDFAHIGSTSIKGMTAKPIVDIMIGLKDLIIEPEVDEQLVRFGYEGFGESGVAGRIHYRKRGQQNINLQITKWDSPLWKDNLLFRDYLRSHPEEARNYSQIKEVSLQNGYNTLLKYSEEKSETISGMIKNARDWERR